ncbi:phosphodiester glycosidase family protein [Ornithinimicrobium cavernae]|uniref:phosphodiester glycosidase family protein n=1 Tax=Ornithinimicrobium cavernae TaxID=2666047 RepID=UPI000D69900B|nr:phosphodiester glycosidase family protein [Ornithinimicrobium cavernae]
MTPQRTRSRALRHLIVAGLVPALLLPTALQVSAQPDTPDPESFPVLEDIDPAEGRRHAASSDVTEPESFATTAVGPDRLLVEETTRPVAPGLEIQSQHWIDAAGFQRTDVLVADLGTEGLSVDYVDPGSVADTAPLSRHLADAGAVAGVNGDFFDINNSGAPQGIGINRDGLVKGPNAGRVHAAGIDAEGLGALSEMFLEGTVDLPEEDLPLTGYNVTALPRNGIGAYTPLWGDYSRDRATQGLSATAEVIVTDGVVTSTAAAPGSGRLPEGAIALVGREAGATALRSLELGDAVTVSYDVRSSAGEMAVAIGGSGPIVKDGEVVPQGDKAVHPRTAVGFSEDRSQMFLVTVDGRMAASRGMSLEELGAYLVELGAHEALNLDGGGSSTMIAREAGAPELDVENEPSDGYQRSVPNGLGLFTAEGSGNLTGLRVVPESEDDDEDLLAVFPGLTRELDALGHDETYAPVEASPRFRATPAAVGTVDGDGTFTARRPGDAEVTASVRSVSDSVTIRVLGELTRIGSTTRTVSLAGVDEKGSFTLVGYDAGGFRADIEPADVSLDYDETLITVEGDRRGGFTVTPLVDSAGTVVTATAGGVETHVAVSIGLDEQVVATFDDADRWTWSGARSTGSLEPTQGRDGGTALQINYDFTRSTGTRTSNAAAPVKIDIEGQPQKIGLWVKGDGRGQWWSFSIHDGNGDYHPLYGPHLTWTGWRYVEVDVPQGLTFPIDVYRFGIIETAAGTQYQGSVAIDDITVKVAPEVALPAQEQVRDDVVVRDGVAVDDGDYSFAVVSDAQFTAANQSLVPAARRTLREALAADPEFIVINGDWVDTAWPEDLTLARRVIEEEIGDAVPWYYVPGNHEIMGPGRVDPWTEEFGAAQHSFVHEGTRYVLLNSATGTLQGGGFEQWQMLRGALDDAAADPSVNGVVAMWHHPPRDPSPVATSQMASAVEVAVVEDWLADFRRETGKGAAMINSHVGSFSATSVDGVPYVINGNAGKAPSTGADAGGFSGWTLVGINPDASLLPVEARHRAQPVTPDANPWIEVEMRPHVDELLLDPAPELAVGASAEIRATVVQGGRSVPVAYPVTAHWTATDVFIGPAEAAGGSHVAAYDPRTGTLTALRAGTGEVSVTVNGSTTSVPVAVRD